MRVISLRPLFGTIFQSRPDTGQKGVLFYLATL